MAFELANKHMENRSKNKLKSSVKLAMDLAGFQAPKMTGAPLAMPSIHVINQFKIENSSELISFALLFQENKKRRRCEFCKQSEGTKDNKTTAVCDFCLKPTCSNHYVRTCEYCYLEKFKDPDSSSDTDGEDKSDDEPTPSASSALPAAKRARVESIINL